MAGFQKHQLAASLLAVLCLGVAQPGLAQNQTGRPAPAPAAVASPTEGARIDELFAELKEPGRENWEEVEGEITRLWSKSGSPSMDLLLSRGNEALEAEDYAGAVEHFSALVDHAPDFAEGWNARATAFFLMGEYSLSIADVEHVLALNPRHFGALSGLGTMLEQMGEPELALRALRSAEELNPNRPSIKDAVVRLERMTGEAEL